MQTRPSIPRRMAALCCLLMALATLAGCSAPGQGVYSATNDVATEEYATDDGFVAEEDAGDWDAGTTLAKTTDDEADAVIIRTGYVSLESRSYDDALEDVRAVIRDADGTITNTTESGGVSRSITIEARVDPEKLEDAVESLRNLDGCSLTNATVNANDVTRTFNDTERRIEILNEQYEHYQRMLEEAQTTEDVLAISDRMYEVLAEIKSYTDTRDDMAHDSQRSMLTVTLLEQTAAGEGHSSSPGGFFSDAWDDSWGIFGGFVRGLVYVIILLFPYALVAAAIVAVAIVVRRKRRAKKGGASSKATEAKQKGDTPRRPE